MEAVEGEHGGMINKFLGDGFKALFGIEVIRKITPTRRSRRRAYCDAPVEIFTLGS